MSLGWLLTASVSQFNYSCELARRVSASRRACCVIFARRILFDNGNKIREQRRVCVCVKRKTDDNKTRRRRESVCVTSNYTSISFIHSTSAPFSTSIIPGGARELNLPYHRQRSLSFAQTLSALDKTHRRDFYFTHSTPYAEGQRSSFPAAKRPVVPL